jgi:hypothetical protein
MIAFPFPLLVVGASGPGIARATVPGAAGAMRVECITQLIYANAWRDLLM